jgi:hypothetical protein
MNFGTPACLILVSALSPGYGGEAVAVAQILWQIDSVREIGGHRATVLGRPQLVETAGASFVVFNGKGDGLILDTNPVSGARSFTVEVIFRPDPSPNKAQRFLHMQASEENRVLIETRLNDAGEWFMDTFIKSGQSEKTLQSRGILHPLDGGITPR